MDRRTQRFEVKAKLDAESFFDKEVQAWVSFCPVLNVYSQGKTQEESREAMKSAILMFVTTCYERSILDNVLNSRGFRPMTPGDEDKHYSAQRISVRPVPVDAFCVDVDLPLFQQSEPARGLPPAQGSEDRPS